MNTVAQHLARLANRCRRKARPADWSPHHRTEFPATPNGLLDASFGHAQKSILTQIGGNLCFHPVHSFRFAKAVIMQYISVFFKQISICWFIIQTLIFKGVVNERIQIKISGAGRDRFTTAACVRVYQ